MRRLVTLLVSVALMATGLPASAEIEPIAPPRASLDFKPMVQEWDFDGTPDEETPRVGFSLLLRQPDSLNAVAHIRGLRPGGVYTFWWVVVQEDGTFPDDIFVALGDGTIVNRSNRATVKLSAGLGDESTTGFMPDGVNEIQFADLGDTMGSTVRIEIAYHGQADDAAGDIGTWLTDFWTGSACPPETPNPNPAQPHCPVYYAATHTAG